MTCRLQITIADDMDDTSIYHDNTIYMEGLAL